MLALAALSRHLRIPFSYITRPQPPNLSQLPGNFSRALALGMHHISLSSSTYQTLFSDRSPQIAIHNLHRFLKPPENTLIIPQGAATPLAEPGIKDLANELVQQITQLRQSTRLALKRPILFLPAGTGTTAYYLNKHLHHIATVIAVPVSGDERYLVRQMRWLQQMSGETQAVLPGVLRPRLRGTFADIRIEKLNIWHEMCRAARDYQFDLVYAPKAWEEVMLAVEEGRIATDGEDLIYYHSGGLEGNDSMLGRSMSAFQPLNSLCRMEIILSACLFPDMSFLCYIITPFSYLISISGRFRQKGLL